MKRLIRDRPLTPEEAAACNAIRQQVAGEVSELVSRHLDRMAPPEQLHHVLQQLKEARVSQGLSLVDLTTRTGVEPSLLLDLETEQGISPTMETLVRYAEAVGKRLQISLTDTRASTVSRSPVCSNGPRHHGILRRVL